MVESMIGAAGARGPALGRLLHARPAGGLDALPGGGAERVSVHGQRLLQLAAGQDLGRHALARGQAALAQRVQGDGRAGVEAAIEVVEVDRLGMGAKRLEGHRLLHVRPPEFAHAHVDRVLPTLEGSALARSRAGPSSLLAPAGRLASPRPLSTPDPLALAAASGGRGQRVKADARSRLGRRRLLAAGLGRATGLRHRVSSTEIRWRTAWSMP